MPIDSVNPFNRIGHMQVETPVETQTRMANLRDLVAQAQTREAQAQNLGLQSQELGLKNQQLERQIAGQRDVEDLIRQNMSGAARPQQQGGAPTSTMGGAPQQV